MVGRQRFHSKPTRRRRCQAERLEDRQLLSANEVYISEVHFGPHFGDPITDQYLEVRGTPGATLSSNLYFLSVESSLSTNPGKINSIFDLSGLTVGANGYIAFLQQDHGFATEGPIHVGTTGGFKGMPNSLYSGFTGQFESITGSESFLIVDTSQGSAPTLSQDIDTNDDGTIEGSLNWSLLDSVSYFKDGSISDDVGYGNIVFRGSGNTSSTFPGNATIVDMNRLGYVGRIGNSTGFAVDDWVAGGTKELPQPFVFEISDGDNSGEPSPGYFAGKTLTNIGSENFVSSIRGSGPASSTIFIDRNSNGVVDNVELVAEPDDTQTSAQLISAFAGVTLTGASVDKEPSGFSITSVNTGANASTGTKSFAYSGIAQFSDIFQLRMDFLRSTDEVSLDFRADGTAIGILEAYGANDNLLGTFNTGQLSDGTLQTMTVTQPGIVWAIAYVDAASPSPSGFLDNLRFVQQEESTTTGVGGDYELDAVNEQDDVMIVKHLPTGSAEAVRRDDLSALDVDFSGNTPALDDIFGRSSTDGSLNVTRPGQGAFSFENWGGFSNAVTWDDILVADVTGDGNDDIVGRTSGQWWVATSDGTKFTNSFWGRWSDQVTWEDVQVADVDGDGRDDIVGRTNGQWWVARSTGTFFNMEFWGNWSNAVVWNDVQVGDFDGDGRDDIAGRTGGQWWVSLSQGTHFTVSYWGNWSDAVTWDDVMVGDYDGDDKADIAGRTSGQWWVSLSQTTYFSVTYWGSWSNISWTDVTRIDLNGDDRTDFLGRTGDQWWAARSTGQSFRVEYWGSWSDAVTWDHIVTVDVNGDTLDDLAGQTGGTWWVGISNGGALLNQYWGSKSDSVNWNHVASGDFGTAQGGASLSAILTAPLADGDDGEELDRSPQRIAMIERMFASYSGR